MEKTLSEWSYMDEAINIVTCVLNKAVTQLGYHHNIDAMTDTYWSLKDHKRLLITKSVQQAAVEAESYVHYIVAKKWDVTKTFRYHVKPFNVQDSDLHSKYYYFEVILSQPTLKYPVPQETVSVFFRFEDERIRPLAKVTWRLEGHYVDHDVRFTKLTALQVIIVLVMKRKFFNRLEKLNMF